MAMINQLSANSYQPTANKKGFTLIELLVVVVIFGVVGLIATNSLFSILRGATKTETIKEVKQNGDFALSAMEIKIRNSSVATSACSGIPTTSLFITNADSTTTTYTCISSGGANRIQETTGTAVNYLTNTSVTIPTCTTTDISFTCTDTNGVKNVMVQFTLRQSQVNANSAESASQLFQNQITLRNK